MSRVTPGLEVLIQQSDVLKGKRVGLVTNHSAVTSDTTHIVDALLAAGVKITALYGPEHGVWGHVADGAEIKDGTDPRTGLPAFSLYGPTKKPTPEMLQDVDVLVYDLQDIGARFYTFTYTMSYCMQACAENGKQYIVLDRPNPVNGTSVEGNILDTNFSSFVGMHPIPIRHGMTIGELAGLFNNEYGFGADLKVIQCQGWKRDMWFEETGLPWVMPSPNMPTIEAAILYTGICYIEGTNVSEARGTSKPFEMAGAPWVDAYKLADYLNALSLPGVRFRPVHFIPNASKHQGVSCSGVQVHIMDRNAMRSTVEIGMHLIKALQDFCPDDYQFRTASPSGKSFFDLLAGTDKTRLAIQAGVSIDDLLASWKPELDQFKQIRQKYLLY
jgi:uncharacterized protein YbbC (DUF1343 family)